MRWPAWGVAGGRDEVAGAAASPEQQRHRSKEEPGRMQGRGTDRLGRAGEKEGVGEEKKGRKKKKGGVGGVLRASWVQPSLLVTCGSATRQ